MWIFSKSKREDELMLVFDIGSSSVGGALFRVQKSGVPKIVFSVREPIVLEEEASFHRFLVLMVRSLEVVVSKICLKGLGAPDRIFCALSSPWCASQRRIVKFEKNTPFVFTSKLADSLTVKEIDFFEKEYLTKYSQPDSPIRAIEFKNIRTKLNGYYTAEPFNQKAMKLEMNIFASISPEQILRKIEESIFKHFHPKKIRFFSFLMSSYTVARDMFAGQGNFLLMDIGGEITDIAMIKKDVLRESISFPMGINFIVRRMADLLGCTLSEAESFFSLYKDGHAAKSVKERLEPVMIKVKTEWLGKFQESLASISNDISIPSKIFITVNQDLAGFFTEIIKTEQFNQYALTESKFQVVFLGSSALHGIAVFEENIIRDPFLIMETAYINRFLYS